MEITIKQNCKKSKLKKHDIIYIQEKYNEVKLLDSQYVMIDLNIKNFRYYNAKYGCSVANEIIDVIYTVLSLFLDENEYVSYLYSDSFVMLLKYEDIDILIYKRIMDLIQRAYRTPNEKIARNIFLSMGIYRIESQDVSFFDALNCANVSRKESSGLKTRCHSIEVFDESIYGKYMDRMELEIKTADAYKNYEFISYLQPKVDLKTGKIIGAEALLRWRDQNGQIVPLNEFLPILNENSYIELVDLDIFDQVCKYLDDRIKADKRVVPISFNFSETSFYTTDIKNKYTDVFEKYSIPKEYIEIEFMESISQDDTERMKEIVYSFKEYGFQCLLDDFGSGYSSFNVLLNAQFDVVKMDRQFFLDNLKGDNRLVIQTVVDLIHSLNMKVVAEGVEQKEHVNFLQDCGCDYVQGYYFYKPMEIDDFTKIIDEEKKYEGKR